MNNTSTPAKGIGLGQWIEHDLLPGFAMEVQGVRTCETDGARPEEHAAYKVTDPEGQADWLCAYDVSPVRHG
jgi:hypothetical protein